ncbi:pentapeptide repeat-containing protein [Streptomyces sp. F63]|nr:pentapeptide repeat-containing protein [Streptomyces sp. F63]
MGTGTVAGSPRCEGTPVGEHGACLAHLTDTDRTAYLASLTPGADVDHRGTPFTRELLTALLTALRDPAIRRPRIGTARFDGALFAGGADFGGAHFTGDAWFSGARFAGDMSLSGAEFAADTWFQGAHFAGTAGFGAAQFRGSAWFHDTRFAADGWFGNARFHGACWFSGALFRGRARFGAARFTGDARFNDARFHGDAYFTVTRFSGAAGFDGTEFRGSAGFGGARFAGQTLFHGARFAGNARFDMARFEDAPVLGPLTCADTLVLSGAVFGAPVVIEAAAGKAVCVRTRWASTGTLRLRYAGVDLTDAVLEYPLTVAAVPAPFTAPEGGTVAETELPDGAPAVRILALTGADAAHLTLNDVDLSACRFSGTLHLDQLRLEGRCDFGESPSGRRSGGPPRRWARRSTLVEEHHWRARRESDRRPGRPHGWVPPPEGTPPPGPATLAVLYRQLRKSLEDGKNEPDAADFYYGEMEMRRHDPTRASAERRLLTTYWALSGYGLRASRAVCWLLGAISVTVLTLMLWGIPAGAPEPERTAGPDRESAQPAAEPAAEPMAPDGSLPERLTAERWEKSVRVAINSVVFRSAEAELTTAGVYIEMASRLTEPLLLGLAVLAVRGRVKR